MGLILNLSAGASQLLLATVKDETAETDYTGDTPGEFDFSRFYTFTGNFEGYFSTGNHLTFSIGGDAIFISGSDSIKRHNNFFLLGGIESVNKRSIPMIGFYTNEIPIRSLAAINTELDMELIKDFHINIMASAAAAQEIDRTDGYSLLAGFGLGVGYMSIIGPLKAGLMFGQYGQEQFFNKIKSYISIGFSF
jgi:hypothetical protein